MPITYLPPFWEHLRQDGYTQHMLTNKLPKQDQETASKLHKRNSKKHFTCMCMKMLVTGVPKAATNTRSRKNARLIEDWNIKPCCVTFTKGNVLLSSTLNPPASKRERERERERGGGQETGV